MANYNSLVSELQNGIYQNNSQAITGTVLQQVLMNFISTLGSGSNFMGILTNVNKPTGVVDGKQFYIGYNASSTAVSIDLTAVGIGTLSITRSKLYVVHNVGGTWSAVDVMAGLSATIPTNVNQLQGISDYEQLAKFTDEYAGDVQLDPLEDNTVYFIAQCEGIEVYSYSYGDTIKDVGNLPTYIFVETSNQFTINIVPSHLLRSGDSLTLEAGKYYLITVRGILWKVEEYA